MSKAYKPRIVYDSRNESGNLYWMLGALDVQLTRQGRKKQFETVHALVLAAKSYDEALSIMRTVATLCDVADQEG